MKRKLRTIVTAVLSAALVFSMVMMAGQQLQYKKNAAAYEEAARLARLDAPQGPPAFHAEKDTDGETGENGGEKAGIQEGEDPEGIQKEASLLADPQVAADLELLKGIDLEALKAVNPDVTGWICIPGTKLSYPLLCGRDNAYYLDHTWDGTPNSGGAIFVDMRCSLDLEDHHTIIYGHRMRNGSMFAPLKDYADGDFLKEHPKVYIADSKGIQIYQIFAAWEPDVTSIVYTLQLDTEEERQALLDICLKAGHLEGTASPGPDDQILTLSTCTGNGHATRWVVQAVRMGQVPWTAFEQ